MEKLRADLSACSDKDKARVLQGFFKTKTGQYGEGDVFLGVTVPMQREIAKSSMARLSLGDIQKLLNSKIHEERLVGLLILVEKYKETPREVYNFYLANTRRVNNWDLVDLSAPKIVGSYLLGKKDRRVLLRLARSENLWEKRIAIVSTWTFIRNGDFGKTLEISGVLLGDEHDLIHKAVGWMLREVGKRDKRVLEEFLRENYGVISRMTLRYAIERFPEEERKVWLRKN